MAGLRLPALTRLRALLLDRGLELGELDAVPGPPPDPRPLLQPLLEELESARHQAQTQWGTLSWQQQLLEASLDAGVPGASPAALSELDQARAALVERLRALHAQTEAVRARLHADLALREQALSGIQDPAAPRLGLLGDDGPLGQSVFQAVQTAILEQHDRLLIQEQSAPEHPPEFYWALKDRLDREYERAPALRTLALSEGLPQLRETLGTLEDVDRALSSGPAPRS